MWLQTPLHAAALDNKHQFVTLLLHAGANIKAKDASGETAYELAQKNRSDDTINIIKEVLGETCHVSCDH